MSDDGCQGTFHTAHFGVFEYETIRGTFLQAFFPACRETTLPPSSSAQLLNVARQQQSPSLRRSS